MWDNGVSGNARAAVGAGERLGSRLPAASLRGGIARFVVLLSGMMVIYSSSRTKVMQIGWMPKERSRILPAAGGLPHPQGARKAGKKGNPPSCHNRAGWGTPVFMRCGEEGLCGSPPPRRGGQARSSPPPSPVPPPGFSPPVLPPPVVPPPVLPPGLPPVPAEGALPM